MIRSRAMVRDAPGGEPTNLVNTTVNGGGGYSNSGWEF